MVIQLKYGIKILVRSKYRWGESHYILASTNTIWGYIILRFRGYRRHNTVFGRMLKKSFKSKEVGESDKKWVKWYL